MELHVFLSDKALDSSVGYLKISKVGSRFESSSRSLGLNFQEKVSDQRINLDSVFSTKVGS